MKVLFLYPEKIESMEILLATKAYEAIWINDGIKITDLFTQYTNLNFQQDLIEVTAHKGQSMSGKDGVPMRLNVYNDTLIKKRNAFVHEFAHRLLFGNGLYAPDNLNPKDNDEIRVLLFQGDVLKSLYGKEDYDYWASLDPDMHTEEHLRDMRYVLSLTEDERAKTIHNIITEQLHS